MSQQTHERERDFEPNGFLYGLIFHLVRPLLKLFFKLDVKVDPELVGLDGPILLMANHLSYMDPLVAAMAIPWRKINFVAGRALYENKLLGWLLRKMNCIPKEQFYPDPGAIKEMFHILRRGGVTLVFPEGQRSIAGGPLRFSEGASKLVKRARATTLVVKLEGPGFALPRWASSLRRGPVAVTVAPFMTVEEAKATPLPEIHQKLERALCHNEFTWQESKAKPSRYRSRKLAHGLEKILYHCPNCDRDEGFEPAGRKLLCKSCGAAYELEPSYFFKEKVFLPYKNPYDWREGQLDRLWDKFRDGAPLYKENIAIQPLYENGNLGNRRNGELTIDGDGCRFRHAPDAESLELRVTDEGHTYVALGEYLQLFGEGGQAYRLTPADPAALARMAEALELYARHMTSEEANDR